MSVVATVDRELRELGMEDSGLGAAALVLAAQLDDPETSATSKSMCAKALLDVLARVVVLASDSAEGDRLDELGARRAGRLAGRAAS